MFGDKGDDSTVRSIFLLDDFSGSGISFIRKENGVWDGKIISFLKRLEEYGISLNQISIHILLYVSTESAIYYIDDLLTKYVTDNNIDGNWTVNAIQIVGPIDCKEEFSNTLEKYYHQYSMNKIENNHYRKGNTDEPHMGFNNGRLPLVLYHNTPNNAFPIIWFNDSSSQEYNALFPRIDRHKGDT